MKLKNLQLAVEHCTNILNEKELYFSSTKRGIHEGCIYQLLSVINYAHDQGDKRIILVNCTKFSEGELITEIEACLNEAEKERTMARVKGMLYGE